MPPKKKSLATKARNIAKKRALEDAETRENRLYKQRMRQAYLRARETTPERINRLSKQRMRQSSLRTQRLKNEMKLMAMRVEEEQRLRCLLQESKKSLPKKIGCRNPPKNYSSQEFKQCIYITCCAPTCNNTSETHILTRLPLDSERRQQWLSRINREAWTTCKNSALCQIHFEVDAWVENALGEKVLKDDVLPTMNLRGEAWSCDVSEVRNITDEAKDEDGESSVYIKQEALEPDIEMKEGTRGVKPFEVYLDSNIEKYNDQLFKTSNTKVEPLNWPQEQLIVPNILPESIKDEPLDIVDEPEQTFMPLSCSECRQDFEEKQDLDVHLREKHSEMECTTRLTNKPPCKLFESMKMLVQKKLKVSDPSSQNTSLNLSISSASNSSTSTQVEGTTQSESPLVPTSQSLPTITGQDTCPVTSQGRSEQFVVLTPETAVVPVKSTSSAVVPSPLPPSTSTTSVHL